jgi:hypothetical protein
MRMPQLGLLVIPCLSGHHSSSSVCNLSRTALIVSLLRYVAFVFRLLVCLVPPWGSRPIVPKGVEGKVEDDIFALISCFLTHLHPYLQHPTLPHPLPPIPLLVASPADRRPPGCGLLIYTLFVSNYCTFGCAGQHHILGGPHTFRDSLDLE